MIEIADREILADRQLEIVAARRQHDRAIEARRPDQRPVDQAAHVFENGIAAMGRFGEAGVASLAERHRKRAVDAGVAQPVERGRHELRIALVILAQFGTRAAGCGFADAADAGRRHSHGTPRDPRRWQSRAPLR